MSHHSLPIVYLEYIHPILVIVIGFLNVFRFIKRYNERKIGMPKEKATMTVHANGDNARYWEEAQSME